MKSIFYVTSSTRNKARNILIDGVNDAIKTGAFFDYVKGKKLVVFLRNIPLKKCSLDYSNANLFELYNSNFYWVDENKTLDLPSKFKAKDAKELKYSQNQHFIENKVFELNENTVIDCFKEVIQLGTETYVMFEIKPSYLKKIYDFVEYKKNNFTENHDLIMSKDQQDKLADFMKMPLSQIDEKMIILDQNQTMLASYIYGFLCNFVIRGKKETGYKTFKMNSHGLIERLFMSRNSNCSYLSSPPLLNDDELANLIDVNTKILMKSLYKKMSDMKELKKMAYFINFDADGFRTNISLFTLVKEVLSECGVSEKNMLKEVKKIFALIPIESKGSGSYFLTMKDFDKELFYKNLSEFFKSRGKVEHKHNNLVFFENLLTEEEIQEQKALFAEQFPIFYQEEISFKKFIQIKPKELKYAEFNIKDLTDLFPSNASYESISNKYLLFIEKIMENYNVKVFDGKQYIDIIEKKKPRSVVSKIEIYFSGEDLSLITDELIQKMLRLIHDNMQQGLTRDMDMDNVARELYLKMNLTENKQQSKRSKI